MANINNNILACLSPLTLKRLRPCLEYVELRRGQIIDRVDSRINHLYFVNQGLVSVVKTMHDGRAVEVSAVGLEGVTDPTALFTIDRALLETIVQIPGTAFRIKRRTLEEEVARDSVFRRLMQNYVRFALGQMAQTAACNCLHSLHERCCRWLLIAHDNAISDRFPMTQEFLAMMLGVQRPSVNHIAGDLRRAKLISYARGQLSILNRKGLEHGACECYGSMRQELERLFD